jgi:putative peptidoglycan lipid II flippase
VVRIVYERGAFDAASTELTGSAFFYYAIGLTFIAINALLVKVYYSMQDMKTPVICGIIGAATNICLNLLLVGPMAHRGLALATSIAAIVNACLLYYWMRRKYPKISIVTDWGKMGKILLSAVLAVGISFGVYAPLMSITSMINIVALGSAVLAACLIYLILLKLFKIEELNLLKDLLKLK